MPDGTSRVFVGKNPGVCGRDAIWQRRDRFPETSPHATRGVARLPARLKLVLTSDQFNLIQHIHGAGKQLVVAVTGGGSRAISALLEVPGASASVLEGIVPYAQSALEDWLGSAPSSSCSERTARQMAMAAFERAQKLSQHERRKLVGIGATASLVSNRPKHGPHRIHVAWQSVEATVAYSCELDKGARNRAQEEAATTSLVLEVIAEAVGLSHARSAPHSLHERNNRRELRAPIEWQELLVGDRNSLVISGPLTDAGAAEVHPESSSCRCPIFPGAFNPFHVGHEQMAKIAEGYCGRPVTLELSLTNVDKPTLDYLELGDRIQRLNDRPLIVTRAPTFAEKALLLPRSVFIVGVDTIARIADPRYYGNDASRCAAAIATLAARDCRFLVFGRRTSDRFQLLTDFDLPAPLLAICDQVPEADFRNDISSTELRNGCSDSA